MAEKEGVQAATPPAAIPPEALAQLIANPQIPKIYLQSFANFASAIDITLVAINCNTATAVVTMTYDTARSLADALKGALDNFEKVMDRRILGTDLAQEKLSKANS